MGENQPPPRVGRISSMIGTNHPYENLMTIMPSTGLTRNGLANVNTGFNFSLTMPNPVKAREHPLHREILGITCVDYHTLGSQPESEIIENVERLLKSHDYVLFVSNRKNKGKFDVNQTIEQHLNGMFPKYDSTCIKNPLGNFRMSSKEIEPCVILAKDEPSLAISSLDRQKITDVLLQLAHEGIIRKSKNAWTILGDERGTPGLDMHGKFIHAWVVIPPEIALKPLNKDFHCADKKHGGKDLITALEVLKLHPEIRYYIFEEHGISKPPENAGVSGSAHYDFWQSTLPLIVEQITQLDNSARIKVFVEQVGMLKPGMVRYDNLVNNVRESVQGVRQEWKEIKRRIDFEVVGKGDHPWHGYSDAVPYAIRTLESTQLQKYSFLPKPSEFHPFRRTALLTHIHELHKHSHERVNFLKRLISTNQKDLQDYVRPFFGHLVAKHVESMKDDDWRVLGNEIRQINDANSQAAVRLILECADFAKIWERFQERGNSQIRFELGMSGLAAANHTGDTSQSENFVSAIEDVLHEANGDIDPEREKQFNILHWGVVRNTFDFEYAVGKIEEKGIRGMDVLHQHDEFWMKGCSELMQNYAYIGTRESMAKALRLSNQIRNVYKGFPDNNHRTRHSIYAAEIRLELGKFEEAKGILETINSEQQDLFFDACWAKLIALSKRDINAYQAILKKNSILFQYKWTKTHPHERILYWSAVIAMNNGDREQAKQWAALLLECANEALNMKDAFGVIVACKLWDLAQKGLLELHNGPDLLDTVMQKSNKGTLKWLANNLIDQENPVEHLYFNYH